MTASKVQAHFLGYISQMMKKIYSYYFRTVYQYYICKPTCSKIKPNVPGHMESRVYKYL